jgi:hypothetical protein
LRAAQIIPSKPASVELNSMPSSSNLPQLPALKSPVDFFREILHADPADRGVFLTNRPPASQKLILAKVHEYEQLKPEECELRLRVTELHYFLLLLINTPTTNRAAQLALIPTETRKLVEDRLEQWDKLSPESQKALMQNEATLSKLMELISSSPAHQQLVVNGLTDAQKAELEAGIRKWQELSPQQQRTTITQFRQFFELTPPERDKTLATLSDAERHQIERTLDSFEKLTPLQRGQCLRSFEKFASLSPTERAEFLKSAERWKAMSPSDRQLWKDLVYNLSHGPPVPAGLSDPPRPSGSARPVPVPGPSVAGTN